MAFVGPGGALLPGIIMLLKQDPEPKEIALPWLAMFYIVETKEDSLRNKIRQFSFRDGYLMCSVDNFKQVKSVIKQYMRDDTVFSQYYFSKEAVEARSRSRVELTFF